MSPAPVNSCRVLEIGCGDASNLIPMAYGLPGSRFTGIDLAAAPIAAGMSPAAADIDASQADARLIGMPIYTSDGLLIGQVTGIETYGSNRSLVAAVDSFMGFGTRAVWIPLNWADKEEDYIRLLLTNGQAAAFLGPGRGIGRR